jgi:hypothetical protein
MANITAAMLVRMVILPDKVADIQAVDAANRCQIDSLQERLRQRSNQKRSRMGKIFVVKIPIQLTLKM